MDFLGENLDVLIVLMLSKKMFHRNGGAPPETLSHVKYDAPREVSHFLVIKVLQ